MTHDLRPAAYTIRTIADLPYDVLLDIFHLLPSHDLVHLLCCCRNLYALVRQDSIWRNLSASYGLQNITHFGGRSWYTVYTRLLHPYGPMLGLWAADNPYTGGILDVRLHSGDEQVPAGIVIDLWQFRLVPYDLLESPEMPEPPTFQPVVRIDFSRATDPHGGAQVVCCCPKRQGVHPHPATIELLSCTNQAIFIRNRQTRHPHPEFPGPTLKNWVDHSRYPLLPRRQSYVVDQSAQVARQRARIPIVFTAPSAHRKPPAISVSCDHSCIAHLRPVLGFDDVVPYLPRYYPVRSYVPPTVDPKSPEWHPRLLVGLWLGSHGPHGTECLYFDWDAASSMLRAWKITGDENVPRGALSWEANMGITCAPSALPPCAEEEGIGDLTTYRLFQGTGVISARGFFLEQSHRTGIIMAVGEPDTLRVLWVEMNESSGYMRYKGRNS